MILESNTSFVGMNFSRMFYYEKRTIFKKIFDKLATLINICELWRHEFMKCILFVKAEFDGGS